MIKKYVKDNRKRELAVTFSFLFAGLTEQFLFNASVKNITVIFIGEVFYKYMKNKAKEFELGSRGNKIYYLDSRKIREIYSEIERIKWKRVLGYLGIVSIIVGCIVFAFPGEKFDFVYVNESQCDYDGEQLDYEKIKDKENCLIVGELGDENLYYGFSRENSNLIEIMEIRYKLSVSIYISVMITAIACVGKIVRRR